MNKEKKEILHWADQIAKIVVERAENDEKLKKIAEKEGYICYDEKTPSGKIHIGSGRGWIIHDVIAKALRDLGKKGRFILSSDDMDPYDKPNKELDESWNEHLGKPFRNIPSPVEGYKSFADYYFTLVTDKFKEFGIEAELESTGERYVKGDFNKAIKKILDNNDKIKEIYERFYGEAPDKIFFNPICEKCGKIGTTEAYEWDKEKEVLKYKCKKKEIMDTIGCGHQGEISPYNGNGKLPWKVEWAAKWPTVGVLCELAGKDHFTHGGSRSISITIADEVLNFEPPYPSTRKNIGKGYEFFTVGGRKMSTSKGAGMGFAESTDYAPATILRYLLVSTRPHAVIDFNPVDKNDLILLYDRFDKAERIYYKKDKVSEEEYEKQKRIYELSHVGEIKEKMPRQIQFSFAAVLTQIAVGDRDEIEILKQMGHLPKSASNEELEYVKERLAFAKKWVHEFAPEHFKFILQEKVSKKVKDGLSDKQKEALKLIVEKMDSAENDKELFEEIYEISKKLDMKAPEIFKAAYMVLIDKERGPKLAPFLMALGKEKVEKIFEQIV